MPEIIFHTSFTIHYIQELKMTTQFTDNTSNQIKSCGKRQNEHSFYF